MAVLLVSLVRLRLDQRHQSQALPAVLAAEWARRFTVRATELAATTSTLDVLPAKRAHQTSKTSRAGSP